MATSIQQEIEESLPSLNHWTCASFYQTVTRTELRKILIHHDTIMRFGRLCEAKTKRIEAGIYKLWYEPREYNGK